MPDHPSPCGTTVNMAHILKEGPANVLGKGPASQYHI